MYLDLWRTLRKELSEHWGSPHRAEMITRMDRLEKEMLAEISFNKNAHKAIKHLRRIGHYGIMDKEEAE